VSDYGAECVRKGFVERRYLMVVEAQNSFSCKYDCHGKPLFVGVMLTGRPAPQNYEGKLISMAPKLRDKGWKQAINGNPVAVRAYLTNVT